MEITFQKLKNEKKNKRPLLLSAMSYALLCDYIICDRFDNSYNRIQLHIDINELNKLVNGSKLFLNGTRLPEFIGSLRNYLHERSLKLTFFINNVEPHIQPELLVALLPFSINIYVCNNIFHHERIHHLPIGLRDPEEVHSNHKHFTHKTIIAEKEKEHKPLKELLCLLCFTINGYIQERIKCYETLSSKPFVTNLNERQYERQLSIHCGQVPVDIFYDFVQRSKYTLAPIGTGPDTHRFYEALYLNSIPIVKRTKTHFDTFYNIFPCLLVNEWSDVTEELLNNEYEKLNMELIKFNEIYKNWFLDPEVLLTLF